MWARCATHGQGHVSPRPTRRVMMSKAGRGLSFGKFLELSFSGRSTYGKTSRRGHLLYRDWILFFGYMMIIWLSLLPDIFFTARFIDPLSTNRSGSSVALFIYSSIDIYSACQPPPVLDFSSRTGQDPLDREARDVCNPIKHHSFLKNIFQSCRSQSLWFSLSRCLKRLSNSFRTSRA